MPIDPPAPLSNVNVNISRPQTPGREVDCSDVYEAVRYRKDVEFARGNICQHQS